MTGPARGGTGASGQITPAPASAPALEVRSALDRDLLAAHCAGHPEAFAELFRRHRDRMWAVALRTTGDREMAADAVQEAFLSAFRRADSFRGDAQVTTWLHRIVVNACLDRLRRARPTTDLDDLPQGRLADPHDQPHAVELRLAVRDALRTLPEGQAAALVLVDMHGLPVAEAAAILGVAEGTIKSRCARGRTALAPLLRSVLPGG
ncbi:MAG: RNA polymerase sigma factor SigM [Austwickia sp.]|nr:RNA polymerase sigma factor SigM [Actinomycetota bacterium]MCB1253683.1 RNA polymerase sigma factor SigM [Austwickia sp.]MCO5310347.1 RNA polymerase sigma factor SigM [Austwickia sp.]